LERRQSGVAARNGESSAQGRWQFINNDWQHSLPWHVRDRLVQFGMPKAQANKVRRYLDRREIATWHGLWQDIGFIETVMDRDGWHHWSGGSRSC
jgi:muramidase (phage lysozyme)